MGPPWQGSMAAQQQARQLELDAKTSQRESQAGNREQIRNSETA